MNYDALIVMDKLKKNFIFVLKNYGGTFFSKNNNISATVVLY
jgi:hypothetical protein